MNLSTENPVWKMLSDFSAMHWKEIYPGMLLLDTYLLDDLNIPGTLEVIQARNQLIK